MSSGQSSVSNGKIEELCDVNLSLLKPGDVLYLNSKEYGRYTLEIEDLLDENGVILAFYISPFGSTRREAYLMTLNEKSVPIIVKHGSNLSIYYNKLLGDHLLTSITSIEKIEIVRVSTT